VSAALAVAGVAGFLLVEAAPAGAASLSVPSPASGPAGTVFTITATGFDTPGTPACTNDLVFYWDYGSAAQLSLGSLPFPVADPGTFSGTAPTGYAPGTYLIEAECLLVTGGLLTGATRFTLTTATTTTTTTPVAPPDTTIGNSWSDSATVQGQASGGAPTGTVTFYSCSPAQLSAAGATTCTSGIGTQIPGVSGEANPATLSPGTGNASSATSPPITPDAVGSWCFAGYYSGEAGIYLGSSDTSASECFTVAPATPTFTTTVAPPASTSVGNSWNDVATVSGNAAGGTPTGSVTFTFCTETSGPCTGGTTVGTVTTPTTVGDVATFTLPPGDAETPTAAGDYCYNASYSATAGGNYASVSAQGDMECFAVAPAGSTTTTQQSTTTSGPGSIVLGPSGTVTDTATVTGNATGGAPTGSITFFECGPAPAALCPSGTQVGAAVTLVPGTGITSTATSSAFAPSAAGTYCFAALYTPGTGANYNSSSDNLTGTLDADECLTVTAATPTLSTTVTTPSSTAIGNSWNDLATVVGNSAGGAPKGGVSFTFCKETSGPCTGGTTVGTVTTPTAVGDISTFTLPPGDAETPTSVGSYCYNAAYTATPGSNYTSVASQVDTECFAVTPAPSVITTQQSAAASGPGSIVIGPGGTVTDTATVTGNTAGAAPTGTVAFTECGPSPSAALCTSGAAVGSPVALGFTGAATSSATSAPFGPPAKVGTYCFAALYTPAIGANYTGSSDNSTGTLDTSECFVVTPADPGFATTVASPTSTAVGNSWNDSAAVTGNTAGGAPTGSVTFTFCTETAGPCTGGTTVDTVTTPTTIGDVSTFTLPPGDAETPTTTGHYCYNAAYSATAGGNYASVPVQSDSECFAVGAAGSTTTTQQSTTTSGPGSIVLGPSGTVTDTATVTGNASGGAPTGSVTFFECGPAPAALCPSGTQVGGAVTLAPGTGITSTATSSAFAPSAAGTYCFGALYTPGTGANYNGSSDNITGTLDADECFTVATATPTLSTAVTAPSSTAIGNSWNDTATVTGNYAGGAPTGGVAFTLCKETSGPCAGGMTVGTVTTPTAVGDVSTFTLPSGEAETPTSVGTYCYNAGYTATTGGNYASVASQSDTECFAVTPAPSVITTQQSAATSGPGSVAIGPGGTVTDTATVTGNVAGAAPTGTVTFTECGPSASASVCASGTAVDSPVTLGSTGAATATATSAPFGPPTKVGTYCFAALYTPASGANYTGSSDNSTGTLDTSECFVVTPSAPTFTTTVASPASTAVGNTWNDVATVGGNAAGGAPTGGVTFTFCTETSGPCTGGTTVGTVTTPTTIGDVSTFTLPPGDAETPTTTGHYCYKAAYGATAGGNYASVSTQSDSECFAVGVAGSTTTTQQSTTTSGPGSIVLGPSGTVTDTATVTGNTSGGAPTGSVTFFECGPGPEALCASGTQVGAAVTLAPGIGITSTATSSAFSPSAAGTYCFAALYTPGTGANYNGSSDNITGTLDADECFMVTTATPTLTTTVAPPASTSVGNSWNDTATVTGNTAGGAPTGGVAFTFCKETSPSTPCAGGAAVGTVTTPTTLGDVSTFTLPTGDAEAPTSVGTYCYNAAYTATTGGSYASVASQSDTECFAVTPASSVTTTQQSAAASGRGSIVIGPGGTVTDTATVTGNVAGAAPTGTVTFTECGPTASASVCTSGTAVGSPVTLGFTGAAVSTATSAAFGPPTKVGTYCFAAVYIPSTGANYTGSSDNNSRSRDPSPSECFTVTPASPTLTTTVASPASTSVGNAWNDAATVSGNAAGGAPTGSVTFTFCTETSGPCTGGTTVDTVTTPTSAGDVSTFTLPPGDAEIPTAAGLYCYNASYSATAGGNYTSMSAQSDGECFAVATPTVTTTATTTTTAPPPATEAGTTTTTNTPPPGTPPPGTPPPGTPPPSPPPPPASRPATAIGPTAPTNTTTSAPTPTEGSAPKTAGALAGTTEEVLLLSRLTIPPAGSVTASGHGCPANAPVELTVGTITVGTTTADTSGAFTTPLNVGSLPVGRYAVVAHCGPVLTTELDVVLATEANPDTSTLLIIIFFVLIGLALFRRRIRLDRPATPPAGAEGADVTSV